MIKMNFDNKLEDEDKHLIHLLKVEMGELPSDQLVERTMTRISAMQAEEKFVFKPLKIPLFIMTAIVLLLLAPLLVPMAPGNSPQNPLSEFLASPESSIVKYTVWCWLAVVVFWIYGLLSQARRNLV